MKWLTGSFFALILVAALSGKAHALRCVTFVGQQCTQFRPDYPPNGGADCTAGDSPIAEQIMVFTGDNYTGWCVSFKTTATNGGVATFDSYGGWNGHPFDIRSFKVGPNGTNVQLYSIVYDQTYNYGSGFGGAPAGIVKAMMPVVAPILPGVRHCTGSPGTSEVNLYSDLNAAGICVTVSANTWLADLTLYGWNEYNGAPGHGMKLKSLIVAPTSNGGGLWLYPLKNWGGGLTILTNPPGNYNIVSGNWGNWPISLGTSP